MLRIHYRRPLLARMLLVPVLIVAGIVIAVLGRVAWRSVIRSAFRTW